MEGRAGDKTWNGLQLQPGSLLLLLPASSGVAAGARRILAGKECIISAASLDVTLVFI